VRGVRRLDLVVERLGRHVGAVLPSDGVHVDEDLRKCLVVAGEFCEDGAPELRRKVDFAFEPSSKVR